MRALLAGVRLRLPVIELNGAFVSEQGGLDQRSPFSNLPVGTETLGRGKRRNGRHLALWLLVENLALDADQ